MRRRVIGVKLERRSNRGKRDIKGGERSGVKNSTDIGRVEKKQRRAPVEFGNRS